MKMRQTGRLKDRNRERKMKMRERDKQKERNKGYFVLNLLCIDIIKYFKSFIKLFLRR
jgi:hypothetical protein